MAESPLKVLAFNCIAEERRAARRNHPTRVAARAADGRARKAWRQGRHRPRGRAQHQAGRDSPTKARATTGRRCASASINADILDHGDADLARPAIERRQARDGAHGRVPRPKPTRRAACRPTARSRIVVVVGNEDGAHHCAAELIQALTEVGFTVAARRRNLLGRRGAGRQGIQGFAHSRPRSSPRPPRCSHRTRRTSRGC